MYISAKADYAARALLELARQPDRPLTCEAVASSQDIPFRFLKSVVGELRRAGLVRSRRGCEGGYSRTIQHARRRHRRYSTRIRFTELVRNLHPKV
ncbi:Rrf2 family transcriptional regulator, partial [Streptomyces hyaluromycini]